MLVEGVHRCFSLSWFDCWHRHISIASAPVEQAWAIYVKNTTKPYTLMFHNLSELLLLFCITHWGRVVHICVGKLTTIGSDNGLWPGRHQAILWTNAGILLIRPLGTNFNVLLEILFFSFKKMQRHPFCLGLNVLNVIIIQIGEIHVISNRYMQRVNGFLLLSEYSLHKYDVHCMK